MLSIMTRLGKRLKYLRKSKTSLSQEAFAFSIDMDRTYYASVENGKRNISILNLEKIANGFGVSMSELFDKIESEDYGEE